MPCTFLHGSQAIMMRICLQCNCPFPANERSVDIIRANRMDYLCCNRCRKASNYQRLTDRICAREGCTRRVPKGNRLLCMECFHNGDSLREPVDRFNESENGRLERGSEAARLRLESQVRVYSAKDMTQEELRSLVPSLREQNV